MAEAADAPVLFRTLPTASGHVFGRATLNAPASLNALSLPMVDLLAPQLQAWATDDRVAGVLLDAAGDKAFCAGGDILNMYRAIREAASGAVPTEAATFFEREYRLDHQIHTYPKPFICWGNGIVMGGGFGLYAGASHRVATLKTRFAMPEIGIGLYPDVGGSWILPRLPGRSGLFLALTGTSVNAADMRFAGLADVVIPHERHAEMLSALSAATWQGNRDADSAQLSTLLASLAQGVQLPESPLRAHQARIDSVIGSSAVAASADASTAANGNLSHSLAMLADIAPRLSALASDADPWLAQAGASFARGSPTSAALACEMQRRGAHLSLADTFRLEWQASIGCCVHPDFAEGVRALLVDKDKNPRWKPASLSDVSLEWLEDHLKPRHSGAHPLADLG